MLTTPSSEFDLLSYFSAFTMKFQIIMQDKFWWQNLVILFLSFINDLPQQVLFSLLALFADDTKCYKTIADIMESTQLQGDLNLLNIWSIDTNLQFNVFKIFHMSFKAQFTTSYSIGSSIISRTDTHKDLGIMISSNLSWETHYNSILIAKLTKC